MRETIMGSLTDQTSSLSDRLVFSKGRRYKKKIKKIKKVKNASSSSSVDASTQTNKFSEVLVEVKRSLSTKSLSSISSNTSKPLENLPEKDTADPQADIKIRKDSKTNFQFPATNPLESVKENENVDVRFEQRNFPSEDEVPAHILEQLAMINPNYEGLKQEKGEKPLTEMSSDLSDKKTEKVAIVHPMSTSDGSVGSETCDHGPCIFSSDRVTSLRHVSKKKQLYSVSRKSQASRPTLKRFLIKSYSDNRLRNPTSLVTSSSGSLLSRHKEITPTAHHRKLRPRVDAKHPCRLRRNLTRSFRHATSFRRRYPISSDTCSEGCFYLPICKKVDSLSSITKHSFDKPDKMVAHNDEPSPCINIITCQNLEEELIEAWKKFERCNDNPEQKRGLEYHQPLAKTHVQEHSSFGLPFENTTTIPQGILGAGANQGMTAPQFQTYPMFTAPMTYPVNQLTYPNYNGSNYSSNYSFRLNSVYHANQLVQARAQDYSAKPTENNPYQAWNCPQNHFGNTNYNQDLKPKICNGMGYYQHPQQQNQYQPLECPYPHAQNCTYPRYSKPASHQQEPKHFLERGIQTKYALNKKPNHFGDEQSSVTEKSSYKCFEAAHAKAKLPSEVSVCSCKCSSTSLSSKKSFHKKDRCGPKLVEDFPKRNNAECGFFKPDGGENNVDASKCILL